MIDTTFLFAAIALMAILIVREVLRKKYNIDMDNIDTTKLKVALATNKNAIKKSTGDKSLVLVNAGENKATVMATLRQISGLDYNTAKSLVDSAPSVLMSNISDDEALLNKQALEFVGAKLEIK